MQFLKKHFEKIILSLAVLGLGAAAFWLFSAVNDAKDSSAVPAAASSPRGGKAKGFTPMDTSGLETSLKNLKYVPEFTLTGEHNLFNPVIWKMAPGGRLFKMTTGGPSVLVVTNIVPFYSTYHYDSQVGDGYWIVFTPANEKKSDRQFSKVGDKATAKRAYVIVSASTNDPVTLQLKVPGADQPVPLTADKDYKQVEGYFADLIYNSSDEKKSFLHQKVNQTINLSGEPYKIISITDNSVTVEEIRTHKRTTRELSGGH